MCSERALPQRAIGSRHLLTRALYQALAASSGEAEELLDELSMALLDVPGEESNSR